MTTFTHFNKQTAALEVAEAFKESIRGRNVLITGVNPGGIGYGIAEAIASQEPALLIMTYRSKDKSEEVISKLLAKYPRVQYRPLEMDLSSQKSIRAAAKKINEWAEHIDVLLNNAGVMSGDEGKRIDGTDIHFATNHLGHFLFTNLILDRLRKSATRSTLGKTRVVNVSSTWHLLSPVRFDDLNFEGNPVPKDQEPCANYFQAFGLDPTRLDAPEVAYAQSKTGNILFSKYLTQHLSGEGILSFAICPGGVMTEIGRYYSQDRAEAIIASGVLDKTPAQGAATALVAALDPALTKKSGLYLENCQFSSPAQYACDAVVAERLWALSENLVKQKFVL